LNTLLRSKFAKDDALDIQCNIIFQLAGKDSFCCFWNFRKTYSYNMESSEETSVKKCRCSMRYTNETIENDFFTKRDAFLVLWNSCINRYLGDGVINAISCY